MPSSCLQEDVAHLDGEVSSGDIAETPVAANDSYELPDPQSSVLLCVSPHDTSCIDEGISSDNDSVNSL
ncbi:hypothetical protein GN958_ATG05589 [Phytophthora infestans]|uniref:Uncharacterized protein n=1 Tax=Phytophthora infestans TaxID=4787 RepID=A0A8S9UW13_PHYIN|nr:hypothetical protein GN958_ATG05589 [Phytophthora infestans]KAI9994666.1 hypothetical protein PInf_011492 [Phytophthora infestans]